jgi:hypothetical protein
MVVRGVNKYWRIVGGEKNNFGGLGRGVNSPEKRSGKYGREVCREKICLIVLSIKPL